MQAAQAAIAAIHPSARPAVMSTYPLQVRRSESTPSREDESKEMLTRTYEVDGAQAVPIMFSCPRLPQSNLQHLKMCIFTGPQSWHGARRKSRSAHGMLMSGSQIRMWQNMLRRALCLR